MKSRTFGRDGSLYSTTPAGSLGNEGGGVFKITPAGTLTVLNHSDGTINSRSGLTLGTDGNFYGTAPFNGMFGAGTVFKITPDGGLATLYDFTDGNDGAFPHSAAYRGHGRQLLRNNQQWK
jgi:uncharacterized repeat protein (TIGR03803 family)